MLLLKEGCFRMVGVHCRIVLLSHHGVKWCCCSSAGSCCSHSVIMAMSATVLLCLCALQVPRLLLRAWLISSPTWLWTCKVSSLARTVTLAWVGTFVRKHCVET